MNKIGSEIDVLRSNLLTFALQIQNNPWKLRERDRHLLWRKLCFFRKARRSTLVAWKAHVDATLTLANNYTLEVGNDDICLVYEISNAAQNIKIQKISNVPNFEMWKQRGNGATWHNNPPSNHTSAEQSSKLQAQYHRKQCQHKKFEKLSTRRKRHHKKVYANTKEKNSKHVCATETYVATDGIGHNFPWVKSEKSGGKKFLRQKLFRIKIPVLISWSQIVNNLFNYLFFNYHAHKGPWLFSSLQCNIVKFHVKYKSLLLLSVITLDCGKEFMAEVTKMIKNN